MKCLGCGTENTDKARLCIDCGRPLTTLRENEGGGGDSTRRAGSHEKERATLKRYTSQPTIDHRTIPDKIKLDYSHGIKDPNQKALEGLQTLLSHFQGSQMDIDRLLKEAAEFIWRQFGIDNVAIGLRDPKDGLYRYRAMVGFRGDAWEAHKKIAYKREQFFEQGEYHGVEISKCSRIYLAENNVPTEEEKGTYNRPVLLAMKRKEPTDSLEGDYIDTCIYGSGDELVGWIEISGTRTMKLPDVTTIRWVEVIASIIAAALICSGDH
jgi:hypothetical protein